MASVEHDKNKRKAPTGSNSRFVLMAVVVVALVVGVLWIIYEITDPDPMALGRGVLSDANPTIVTDPASGGDGVQAPLTVEAQGATRTELTTTPPDTTPD
ncbi:hypothetical protein [Jannaschia formosa]|uniref:hypothetical protein n=1 Tax=Jannaschia formosa TaxID=2259592 RepID=UPI000E1BD421|nr:hypothetical protein [Jannaschia formosa]TFL20185.1 hypothetical protein DR046_02230 [Jannaschia formosa]